MTVDLGDMEIVDLRLRRLNRKLHKDKQALFYQKTWDWYLNPECFIGERPKRKVPPSYLDTRHAYIDSPKCKQDDYGYNAYLGCNRFGIRPCRICGFKGNRMKYNRKLGFYEVKCQCGYSIRSTSGVECRNTF